MSRMNDAECDLKDSCHRLKQSLDNISDAIRVLTINYRAIAGNEEGATIPLPFRDMTGQDIARVIGMLTDYIKRLDAGDGSKETSSARFFRGQLTRD